MSLADLLIERCVRFFLTTAVLGAPLAAVSDGGPDLGATLLAYGVAAPFAVLCWIQLQRAQKREEAFEQRLTALQDAAVARERELAGQLASRLYDASLLYREGTAKLADGLQRTQAPEIQQLIEQMQTLVRKMETP